MSNNSFKIIPFLKVAGYVTFCAAFVIGISMAEQFSKRDSYFLIAAAFWLGGFVFGSLLLGIAELIDKADAVITLLKKNKDK